MALATSHRRTLSEETKKKISESMKGKNTIGHVRTEETRRKIAAAKMGDRHPNWRGGLSFDKEYRHHTNTVAYRNWRIAVFKRDNFTCQECGKNGVYIEAHHIEGWSECPSKRYDIDNGKTLCRDCHKKTLKKVSFGT